MTWLLGGLAWLALGLALGIPIGMIIRFGGGE